MKLKLLIATLVIAFLAGCSSDNSSNNEKQTLKKGETIKKSEIISLESLLGEPIEAELTGEGRIKDFTFSNAKDKVVIAMYWSTNCPSCIAEIPHLIKLQEKYPDSLKVLGVLVEDKAKEDVEEFVAYHEINYDTLYGEANYELADAMGGVRGIPAMFIFKKDGTLHKNFVGLLPPEMLEAELKKIL